MELRIISRKDGDNWVVVPMKDLKIGDIFKSNDIEGCLYKVDGAPYLNEENVWTVLVDALMEETDGQV